MAKTKISEFSATPANNTDIDSINIAEGCAPSGINDAIRELMAQLKDFQTGAVGDSFNGPVGTTTPAAGAFTTLSATGNVTLGDASTDTLNVGNGGLVKDASGNVGIGTSSPTLAKLQVTGTAYIQDTLTISSVNVNANITDATGSNITLKAGNSNLSVNQGAGYITATVQAVERMRLNANGALVLSGGNTSASGVGITFPATQSASSDANTLDDYEEGTWTPTQGGGLTVVGTFSSFGRYIKIGKTVTLIGRLIGSTSVSFSASNALLCAGLPFATDTTNILNANSVGANEAANASAVIQAYGSSIYSQGSLSATTNFYFSVTYITTN